jgi:hypothetical protein
VKSGDAAPALALLALATLGGKKRAPAKGAVVPPGDTFAQTATQWPMPTMLVRKGDIADDAKPMIGRFSPVVSDGFRKSRADHQGVDIMYKREMARSAALPGAALQWLKSHDAIIDWATRYSVKTWDAKRWPKEPEGTEWFFCPKTTPVKPFASGRIWNASASPRGFQVVIDHGEFVSYYQHLSKLNVPLAQGGKLTEDSTAGKKGDTFMVSLSTFLGRAGADPTGGTKTPVHLHFELWKYVRGAAEGQQVRAYLDPEVALQSASQWFVDVAEL